MEIYYIIAICSFVALAIYWLIFKPLIDYSIYNTWWQENGGSDCIDITAISYWKSNKLVYLIYNIIQPADKQFSSDAEIEFVSNLLLSYAAGIAPNGQLTPDDFCVSLVPSQIPRSGAWPTTYSGWQTLIAQWAGIDIGWPGNGQQSPYSSTSATTWVNPDNFLWTKLNINYDSPAVLGFVTGYSIDHGQALYPFAMWPLFNIGYGSGIIGMVKQISSPTVGVSDFENYLWSKGPVWYQKDGSPNIGPNVNTCTAASVAGSIFSGITQGIFIGSMLAPAAALGPLGIAVGLGVAVIGALIGVAQNKCFNSSPK